MNLDFTAVDVETANADRGSICAIGAVKVRSGRVVDTYTTLVRPPIGLGEFTAIQYGIHGIGPDDVRDAPEWDVVHPGLIKFMQNDLLVAHNAAFDISVLSAACRSYGIQAPQNAVVCTRELAKVRLSLPRYRLPTVARHLGIPRFQHHNALADATAAAQVFLALHAMAPVPSPDSAGVAMPWSRSRVGRAPDYVVDQACRAADETNYTRWLRLSLAHPLGPAHGGENCVMCEKVVPDGLPRLQRDRHVCSGECEASLKQAAKRAWKKHGIIAPAWA